MDMDIISQNLARNNLETVKKKADSLAEKQAEEKELKDACAGFEAILMHSMIKSMRASMPGDALFPESNDTNIYKSMYDQYLSDELAKGRNGIGIKDYLFDQLKDTL